MEDFYDAGQYGSYFSNEVPTEEWIDDFGAEKADNAFDSVAHGRDDEAGFQAPQEAEPEHIYDIVHAAVGQEDEADIQAQPDFEPEDIYDVVHEGAAAEEGWKTEGNKYLGRRVRRIVCPDSEPATVVGWMPVKIANFISEHTNKPAALWRIRYDDAEQFGEEDLEEFELKAAIAMYKKYESNPAGEGGGSSQGQKRKRGRPRKVSTADTAEPAREDSVLTADTAEPAREDSVLTADTAEPAREDSVLTADTAEPAREDSALTADTAEPAREDSRDVCEEEAESTRLYSQDAVEDGEEQAPGGVEPKDEGMGGEGEWLTEGSEYLGSRVRRAVFDDEGQISYAEDGTVVGWLPVEAADFISEHTNQPAALWHIKFDAADLGEEDLEEFEVKEAIEALKVIPNSGPGGEASSQGRKRKKQVPEPSDVDSSDVISEDEARSQGRKRKKQVPEPSDVDSSDVIAEEDDDEDFASSHVSPGAPKRNTNARKKDPNAPRRPKSAFLIWFHNIRDSLQSQHPDLSYVDLTRRAAKIWHSRPAEFREPYEREYMDLVEQFKVHQASHAAGEFTPMIHYKNFRDKKKPRAPKNAFLMWFHDNSEQVKADYAKERKDEIEDLKSTHRNHQRWVMITRYAAEVWAAKPAAYKERWKEQFREKMKDFEKEKKIYEQHKATQGQMVPGNGSSSHKDAEWAGDSVVDITPPNSWAQRKADAQGGEDESTEKVREANVRKRSNSRSQDACLQSTSSSPRISTSTPTGEVTAEKRTGSTRQRKRVLGLDVDPDPRVESTASPSFGSTLSRGASTPEQGQRAGPKSPAGHVEGHGRAEEPTMESGAQSPSVGTPGKGDSWFIMVVEEHWKEQRGFRLYEICSAVEPTGLCRSREWCCSAEIEGSVIGSQKFLQSKGSRKFSLATKTWLRVNVLNGVAMSGKGKLCNVQYSQVVGEQDMVTQAYRVLDGTVPQAPFCEGEQHSDPDTKMQHLDNKDKISAVPQGDVREVAEPVTDSTTQSSLPVDSFILKLPETVVSCKARPGYGKFARKRRSTSAQRTRKVDGSTAVEEGGDSGAEGSPEGLAVMGEGEETDKEVARESCAKQSEEGDNVASNGCPDAAVLLEETGDSRSEAGDTSEQPAAGREQSTVDGEYGMSGADDTSTAPDALTLKGERSAQTAEVKALSSSTTEGDESGREPLADQVVIRNSESAAVDKDIEFKTEGTVFHDSPPVTDGAEVERTKHRTAIEDHDSAATHATFPGNENGRAEKADSRNLETASRTRQGRISKTRAEKADSRNHETASRTRQGRISKTRHSRRGEKTKDEISSSRRERCVDKMKNTKFAAEAQTSIDGNGILESLEPASTVVHDKRMSAAQSEIIEHDMIGDNSEQQATACVNKTLQAEVATDQTGSDLNEKGLEFSRDDGDMSMICSSMRDATDGQTMIDQSLDVGVPCRACAQQNKGVAACFAQGHLYRTHDGQLPFSCKGCKKRNKGAMYCFKRGHLPNLLPVLSQDPPPATPAPLPDAKGEGKTSAVESPVQSRLPPKGALLTEHNPQSQSFGTVECLNFPPCSNSDNSMLAMYPESDVEIYGPSPSPEGCDNVPNRAPVNYVMCSMAYVKMVAGRRIRSELAAAAAKGTRELSKLQEAEVRRRRAQLTFLREELVNLIETEHCAPIVLRLAWQDAASFRADHGGGDWPMSGGVNGSVRIVPEVDYACHKGLAMAISLLHPFIERFPLVSAPDLYQMAAAVAIEQCGGPQLSLRWGRCQTEDPEQCAPEEACPSKVLDPADVAGEGSHTCSGQLRKIFRKIGLDEDREMVCLMGAHTLGRAHKVRTREGEADTPYTHDGPGRTNGGSSWTKDWLVFDNSYFKALLDEEADPHLLRLDSDLALVQDPRFRCWVELYAHDQGMFFADYAAAHTKMSELGAKFDPEEGIFLDTLIVLD